MGRLKESIDRLTFGNPRRCVRFVLWRFLDSLVTSVPSVVMVVATWLLVQPIVHPGAALDFVALWACVAVLAAQVLASYATSHKVYVLSCAGTADAVLGARLAMGEKLRRLPLGFYQRHDAGDIDSVLLRDYETVENYGAEVLSQAGMIAAKTTLSAVDGRQLIGDDEHGWSEECVFNIEGGCYAKCIDLSEESEPLIFKAIRFGSVTENVALDPDTRIADYADSSITENTRVAYPVGHIASAKLDGVGQPPSVVVFLTADAFGVLPPIARLTPESARYHFLTGFTAKVAGTEQGIVEPQPTFSALFGEPFMPLDPLEYARLLEQRITATGARVYLVNTGWTGGGYGTGHRISLPHTRKSGRFSDRFWSLAILMDTGSKSPRKVAQH